MVFKSSGQFSINEFVNHWTINEGGVNYGRNLNGWRGQAYNNGSIVATFPNVNMSMFLFYGKGPYIATPPGGK